MDRSNCGSYLKFVLTNLPGVRFELFYKLIYISVQWHVQIKWEAYSYIYRLYRLSAKPIGVRYQSTLVRSNGYRVDKTNKTRPN